MSWEMPIWLWSFLLLTVVIGLTVGMGWIHSSRLRALFSESILERVLPGTVRRRRLISSVASLLGCAGLIIALAGPRFGKEIRTVQAEGVDLVLVLDVSRSMDATDVTPSRLERAKREVIDLLEIVEGDRIGLVVYAGGAFPRVPLTMDYMALSKVVRELDSESVGAQGSALGAAVRLALELLSTDTSSAGKAMLILSDGEVHETSEALAAASEASRAQVTIYGMGIGEENAPIPIQAGGFLEHEGQMVLTSPRTDLLTELARRTGGAFVQSTPSQADILGLYRDEMRSKLQSVERSSRQREQWREGFYAPMLFGGFCLFLASWLGDGRQILIGLLLVLALSERAYAGESFDGDQDYRAGRFQQAADRYGEGVLLHPEDSLLWQRLGAARYRAGDFEGAADAFSEWGRLVDGQEQITASFNEGNALYKAGRLEEALERYGSVLERNPEHGEAKNNSAVVQADLEARRQQRPPEQQQQDQQQDQQQQQNSDSNEQQQQDPENQSNFNNSPTSGEPNSQASSQQETDPEQAEAASQSKQSEESSDAERDPSQSDELQDAESGSQQQGQEGEGEEGFDLQPGEITRSEAERILDGVEEGSPRTRPPSGYEGDRPW